MRFNFAIRRYRLQDKRAHSVYGEEDYLAFLEKHLSPFKKKPRVLFFTYHNRAGSKQLKDKGMSLNTSREKLDNLYCPRFDRWVHFLYTGEPILCCMDYNRETVFNSNINDKSIKELYSFPRFNKQGNRND